MSQSEILFNNSLPCSSLTNLAEGHIIIGKDRKIVVPDNLKRIAVQYDHNVETVTFDCPRYWDGLDMSTMNVYINYLCADRTSGTFRAANVAADKHYVGTMHFDWVISKNVSMTSGKISFQVCVKKTDADGNEVVHWNSEICRDCYVSESLNCNDGELNEVYPDIFEQWHREWVEYVYSGEFTGPPGVSPTITVTDIDNGHRVTVTDINGTQSFDVSDTFVEADDAVIEMVNNIIKVGNSEPTSGPAIWFEVTDDVDESCILKYKDETGTVRTFYPATKTDYVEGFSELSNSVTDIDSRFISGVAKISNGGTGATTAEGARTNLGAAAEGHKHDISEIISDTLSTTYLPTIPISKGGTGSTNGATGLKKLFAAGATVISSNQYGTSLPSAGTAGRIFFKKVGS